MEKRHLVALRPPGGHASHRFRQLALVQPGKAEARKGLRLTVECLSAAGVPRDASLKAALGPRFDVDGHPQADPQRHSSARECEFHAVAKGPAQTVCQNLAAVRVHAAGARDVPLQLAILDQRCDGGLRCEVSLDVQQRADRADAPQDRGRRDEVADAKPRGEDLGERADVDDGSAWSALASGSTGRPS